MKLVILQSTMKVAAIIELYLSLYKSLIENSVFLSLKCVSSSFTDSSAINKLAFVYLGFFNLSTMKVFQSISKLPYILLGVGSKHSIPMNLIVFPFTNILNSISISILIHFQLFKIKCFVFGNILITILRQSKAIKEIIIKLLNNCILLYFYRLFLSVLQSKNILSVQYSGIMKSLLIQYPINVVLMNGTDFNFSQILWLNFEMCSINHGS